MARQRSAGPPAPIYYATTAYKQWARAQLAKRGWSLDRFAEEIERVGRGVTASSGGLSPFFGKEGKTPTPSNTALMPAMNKVLGIAPPPVCNPEDPLAQLHDRLAARWSKLSSREQQRLLTLFNAALGDDESEDS